MTRERFDEIAPRVREWLREKGLRSTALDALEMISALGALLPHPEIKVGDVVAWVPPDFRVIRVFVVDALDPEWIRDEIGTQHRRRNCRLATPEERALLEAK